MANRYGYQFLYSRNPELNFIEGNFVVGASGAVGAVQGSGVSSVVKLEDGTYQINLEDGFPHYLIGNAEVIAPTTGSAVADGSFVVGTTYVISDVGTGDTDWEAAGVASGVTPAVGVPFVAISIGGAGSGEALAVAPSQIVSVQVVGNPQTTIGNGIIIIQCVDDAGAVANPEQTATVNFSFMLRNSTLKGKGEA